MNASEKQGLLSRVIAHPFAFALFPILSLYAPNVGQTYPEMIVLPALIMHGGAGLLYGLLRIVLRKPQLAGLITSICVLYFSLYGSFTTFILRLNFGSFLFTRNVHRIPVYTCLFLLLSFGFYKLYRRWNELTKFLNIISLVLLLLTSCSLGWSLVFSPGKKSTATPVATTQASETNSPGPDIYYIVLDGYAGVEVFAKYFGYDNSPFLNSLKSKGFSLPAKARCNYPITASSMASTLNMGYLEKPDLDQALHTSLDHKAANNNVRTFAEKHGYQYTGFTSMNAPVAAGQKGSWRSLLQNEFALQFLRTTVLDPVGLRFNLYADPVRNNILSCFDLLKEMPEKPGKKLVYAHIIAPHPPYIFNADGSRPGVSFSPSNLSVYRTYWDDTNAYVQQVKFLNAKVTELIDTLMAKSKTPPVIVLQSDHGPKITLPDDKATVDMQMHILNAYYFPGNDRSALYETITPANSFRAIFNQYLQAKLPLLEDKCYFCTIEKPYALSEVTAQVSN